MKKISFIVPIYNAHAYLNRCLDSLLSQTYLNIEILLIDDGSFDDSLSICQNYEHTEQRIIVYSKSHTGLSDTRNYGLDRATGEIIGFLDSDDWLEPQFTEILLSHMNAFDADICSCNSRSVQKIPADSPLAARSFPAPAIYTPEEYITLEYANNEVNVRVGNRLYRKRLFDDIRFPINRLYEDVLTNYLLCRQCSRMTHVHLPLHNYFVGNVSITRSPLSSKDLDLVEQCKQVYELACFDFPQMAPLFYARKLMALRSLANKYLSYGGDKEVCAMLVKQFRKEIWKTLLHREIPIQKKLRCLAGAVSIKAYACLTSHINQGQG